MNWRWRVSPGACTPELAEEIRDFTALYGRIPQPPKQKKAGSKKPD